MPVSSFGSPRLLVSVRNLQEAQLAARAGVELIDFKEPQRGSLGKMESLLLAEIVAEMESLHPRLLLSAAWGELRNFAFSPKPPTIPNLSYLKLGLAGMGNCQNWGDQWKQARDQLLAATSNPPGWVAVAYVDVEKANSPPIKDVLSTAIQNRAAGMLFDTFCKTGAGLRELISRHQLQEMIDTLHHHGLMAAVAGKVTLADLPELCESGADIIAVRSAACAQQKRTAELDPHAIQQLLLALKPALDRNIPITTDFGSVHDKSLFPQPATSSAQ